MDKKNTITHDYETANPLIYETLKNNAKKNRKYPTEAEALLWERFRDKKLSARFRRQHPIGDYIADFISLKKKLVIEVGGEYHQDSEQQIKDEARTRYLNSIGYEVLRFTNDEAINDMENVLTTIIHPY